MAQTTYPDYHFLYFAPTLGAEWFFDAARLYFERFFPTVLTDLGFLRFIPPERSVNVTVIARRDTVAEIGVELARIRPTALFDPVSYDLFDDMEAALDARARTNQPFGVPLTSPDTRLFPTPGSILVPPTRQPGGFITQTPTPVPTEPTPLPTTPAATDTPRSPIQPTPGPIIGG